MSNLYFNIRFGSYHFQWAKDGTRFSFEQSPFWKHYYDSKHPKPKEPWFKVYAAFGHFYN